MLFQEWKKVPIFREKQFARTEMQTESNPGLNPKGSRYTVVSYAVHGQLCACTSTHSWTRRVVTCYLQTRDEDWEVEFSHSLHSS